MDQPQQALQVLAASAVVGFILCSRSRTNGVLSTAAKVHHDLPVPLHLIGSFHQSIYNPHFPYWYLNNILWEPQHDRWSAVANNDIIPRDARSSVLFCL